jgi:hypothetical protein
MDTKNKKIKIAKYILYTIIFIFSFTLAYIIQTNYFFKGILALPAVGSLLSLLYKIYKDDRAHERTVELQTKQHDFILGTASHMAEVAYDKHVLFCEAYIERVQKGFQELLRDGPSANAMTIGRELVNIRQKHAAWLTKEIEAKLKPFEQTLIRMGAKDGLIYNLPMGEKRNKMIEEVYKSFGLILGHEKPTNEEEEGLAIDEIIEKIRVILGISILTEMRLRAAELAVKRISNT